MRSMRATLPSSASLVSRARSAGGACRCLRRKQRDELLLRAVRELDRLLQIGELLDRLRERVERIALGLLRLGELLARERLARMAHRRVGVADVRQRDLEVLDHSLLLGG